MVSQMEQMSHKPKVMLQQKIRIQRKEISQGQLMRLEIYLVNRLGIVRLKNDGKTLRPLRENYFRMRIPDFHLNVVTLGALSMPWGSGVAMIQKEDL